MSLGNIESHREFAKFVESLDTKIADLGFAPRELYEKLSLYRTYNSDKFTYKQPWIVDGVVPRASKPSEDYYQHDNGQVVYLYVLLAKSYSDRNKVVFVAKQKAAAQKFRHVIAELEILANKANDDIAYKEASYALSPDGIEQSLSNMCREMYNNIINFVDNRGSNYRVLQTSTSSDRRSTVFEHQQNDMVGRITMYHGETHNVDRIIPPKITIHFEDPIFSGELQAKIEPLAQASIGYAKRILEAREAENVVDRLLGVA